MTPELRNGLFAVDPVELGVDLLDAHVEEQANLQKEGIIEADEGMLEMLTCMGIEEPMAKAVLVAVRNAGIAEAFEYLEVHRDSLQQQLDSKTQEDSKRKIKKPRYIPLELQRLFAELTALNRFSVSTEG